MAFTSFMQFSPSAVISASLLHSYDSHDIIIYCRDVDCGPYALTVRWPVNYYSRPLVKDLNVMKLSRLQN